MEEKIHMQVKDNSPSIERILHPISYMSWLLGVGVAHPRKCPKAVTIIIRIIHMAVISFIMICDTLLNFSSVFNTLNAFVYMCFLNSMTCYVLAYYCVYLGIRQYNKWPELMDRLKELDQKIRKEISMNDRSVKIVEALAVLTTFTFCPLLPIIHILFYCYNIVLYPAYETFIIDILFYYILAQLLINSFVFDVVVYVLYCRFQTINKLIGQLDKLSDVLAFKIRRIRELHTDICDLACIVNDFYGLHLLFCSANCFTMAVISLCNLFLIFMDGGGTYTLIYQSIFFAYAMQFCLICWVGELACQEANRTGRIIHKIILNCKPENLDEHEASNLSSLEVRSTLEVSNGEQNSNCNSSHNQYVVENFFPRNLDQKCVTKEVNNFSIQLQENRVSFTACDFFEINHASLGYFVGVIFT